MIKILVSHYIILYNLNVLLTETYGNFKIDNLINI